MRSVDFSSGHANFAKMAFRPNAIGFCSKEMFCAPSAVKV